MCCPLRGLMKAKKKQQLSFTIQISSLWDMENESFFLYPILISTRADCLDRAKYIM
ncbi:THO complex subunit 2, partial [Biomphalaria glabrata]